MSTIDFIFFGEEIPISKRLIEYIYAYINKTILEEKNIILNSKYSVMTSFSLNMPAKFRPDKVYIPFKTRSVGATKLTTIVLPAEKIKESDNPQLKFLELMFEGLKLYFTENYKKISNEFMDLLWQNIDFDYIKNIPYPPNAKDSIIYQQPISKQFY